MKKLIFLFVFIFSTILSLAPLVSGNIKTDKTKKGKNIFNKTQNKEIVEKKATWDLSRWQVASATYYDSQKTSQTGIISRGIGASGRLVRSGSVALGSVFSEAFVKKGAEVFIEVEGLDVDTPYGKNIFRIDDIMAPRFRQRDRFYIDFYYKDLDLKHKRIGRFNVKFRVCDFKKG